MGKGPPRFPLRVVAVLAAVAMACASLLGFVPVTRQGVFCPTAPIQSVLKVKRDCCGRVTAVEKRAPRPGEREFVQCRCAEKKSADHTALVSSKLVLFLEGEATAVKAPMPGYHAQVFGGVDEVIPTQAFAPEIPPPSARVGA